MSTGFWLFCGIRPKLAHSWSWCAFVEGAEVPRCLSVLFCEQIAHAVTENFVCRFVVLIWCFNKVNVTGTQSAFINPAITGREFRQLHETGVGVILAVFCCVK